MEIKKKLSFPYLESLEYHIAEMDRFMKIVSGDVDTSSFTFIQSHSCNQSHEVPGKTR